MEMCFFCKKSFGKEYDEYNILLSGKIFTFAHVSKMFCEETKKEAELQHGIQLLLWRKIFLPDSNKKQYYSSLNASTKEA